jgi:hypothetical protein
VNRINSHNNNLYLRKDIKIAILLIVGFVFRTNGLLTDALAKFAIPALRYQQLWFFILPGAYILFVTNNRSQRKFNYIGIFLLFYLTHYFMEHWLYGQYYIPGYQIDLYKKIMTLNFTGMDLLMRWEIIYITYIFFINTRMKYFEYVIKCTIIILLINTSLIYLDVLDIINIADIKRGFGGTEGRLYSNINLNMSCDQNVFAIYCLGIMKINQQANTDTIWLNVLSLSICAILVPLLFLQASRGAMILLIAGLSLFMVFKTYKLNLL